MTTTSSSTKGERGRDNDCNKQFNRERERERMTTTSSSTKGERERK